MAWKLAWVPGTTELIIILVVVLILFGGSRIPALAKGLGQGLRDFKKALKGDEEESNMVENGDDKS